MTFNEYYGFPEGTNATQRYMPSGWYDLPSAQLPSNCSYLFARNKVSYLCPWDVSNVTNMSNMFDNGGMSTLKGAENWDVSKATSMSYMFNSCTNLSDISALANWDVSNVTNMSYMFQQCSNLRVFDVNWDTSKVTTLNRLFYYCSKLTSISAIDCSLVGQNNYPLYQYGDYTSLIDVGGFLNMKSSWNDTYGLCRCPNLTYESCINILNGLYDFTGHNETPSSSQGLLRVNQNFLDKVGDEISIGTDKGWQIIV